MEQLLNYILENWETGLGIAAIILEIGLRLIPTEKNRSIFDLVVKTISFVIKNRRKPSPLDEIEGTKNKVWVDVKKHIIPVVFIFASLSCVGQVNSTFKSARSYNSDSTTVRAEVQALQNFYGDIGALYYNEQSSKWRIFSDSVWSDLIGGSGGGGGSYTFQNGLTESSNVVKQGGSFTEDTFLDGDGFSYGIQNANDIGLYSNTGSFSVDGALTLQSDNDDINLNATTGDIISNSIIIDLNADQIVDLSTSDGSFFRMSGGTVGMTDANSSYVGTLNGVSLLSTDNLIGTATGYVDITDGNSHTITSQAISGLRVGIPGQNFIDVMDNGNIDLTIGNEFNLNGLASGSAGNVLYYNDATGAVSWDAAPGGGGITNTAANTELAQSDGTNLVPSGVFMTSSGNMQLGSSSLAGVSHTLTAGSSAADCSLILSSKGSSVTTVAGNGNLQLRGAGSVGGSLVIGEGTGGIGRLQLIGNAGGSIIQGGIVGSGTDFILRGFEGLGLTTAGGEGGSITNNGGNALLRGGNGYTTSGNGNGGNVTIQSGQRRVAGSGTDGNITIDALTGFIILNGLPGACTGVPTNGLANVGGVLTICP